MLHDASAFQEAINNVSHLKVVEAFLDPFSNHLQTAFETTDSLGRSLIIAKDAHYNPSQLERDFRSRSKRVIRGTKNIDDSPLEWFTCASGVDISFDVIPEAAAKSLYHRALVVSGVEQESVKQAIKDALLRAMAQHESYDDFKKDIDEIIQDSGVDIQRIQTIFRTNLSSLYSEGELNQVREMGDAFPVWRYSAIRDLHTRPTHWAFNGTVWAMGDGPIPPIDYNCRCSAIYLHRSEAADLQPLVYHPENYIDPDTGDLVVRFDNRTNFGDSWTKQQQDSLPVSIQSWINDRLTNQS